MNHRNLEEKSNSIFFSKRVFIRKFVLLLLLLVFFVCFGVCVAYLLFLCRKRNVYYWRYDQRESQDHPLKVSNFGANEYECLGSCYCLEEAEEEYDYFDRRRITTSLGFGRQMISIVAAVTSIVALRIAGDQFKDDCETMMMYDGECIDSKYIRSEVEECYVLSQSGDSENDLFRPYDLNQKMEDNEVRPVHIRCYGYCEPATFDTEDLNKQAQEFDCEKMKSEEDYLMNTQPISLGSNEDTSDFIDYFKREYQDLLDGECLRKSRIEGAEMGLCKASEYSIQCFPYEQDRFGEEVSTTVQNIRSRLHEIGDPERARLSEGYFKGVGRLYGLKMKELTEEAFNPIYEEQIKNMDLVSRIHLAIELLESNNLDDKKFAVLILKKNAKNIFLRGEEFVEDFFRVMEIVIDNSVYDWYTADKLSMQVFDQFLRQAQDFPNLKMEEIFMDWALTKSNRKGINRDWRQRIACVSFVKLARFGDYNDEIIELCETCVKNKYRFTQLGVGWLLREMSLNDLERVVEFIKDNYHLFSREGLRYAIEKMEPGLRKELLDFGKRKT